MTDQNQKNVQTNKDEGTDRAASTKIDNSEKFSKNIRNVRQSADTSINYSGQYQFSPFQSIIPTARKSNGWESDVMRSQ